MIVLGGTLLLSSAELVLKFLFFVLNKASC
jgi:hypothetical protein